MVDSTSGTIVYLLRIEGNVKYESSNFTGFAKVALFLVYFSIIFYVSKDSSFMFYS